MRWSLPVLAIVLVGCGGGVKKDDLVGNWTGSAGMTYAAMQKDAGGDNEQSRFLAGQEMEDKHIDLELKADGTAVFQNERIVNGTWKLEGGRVVLDLPKPVSEGEGKSFSGTYNFQFEEAGVMKADDPNVDGYFLRFRKE